VTVVDEPGVPFGTKLRQLATADPTGRGLVVVARDGSEQALTWADLEARANQWCRAMQSSGVAVGERVALAVPNSVDLVLAALGAWKAGAVPVPVRWDLPDWERERLLAVVDAALVVDEVGLDGIRALAAAQDDGAVAEETSPQVNGICSSGATGTPKVIVSARPALWAPASSEPFMTNWRPVPRPQIILVPGPIYHTNGFATLQFLIGGDQLVMLEKFNADLILDVIERHRITTFTATPTMLQRIAAADGAAQRDLSSVEWILQGAAVMPASLLQTWFDLLAPEKVIMAYGMTEQLGLTALRGDEWLTHQGSVGRGFRGTEIKILAEDGSPVPTGELGDIYLRWPMTGAYTYRGGAALLPTTADGFGTAGDVGWVDAEGFLYLVDRRVDMIISGGANVFPAEVESALADHPGIADVVVLGLRDEQWGRRVHAVVQPADRGAPLTESDVIAYAKSRLAAYKVPKTVEFVAEMPRSAATKVSRSAMTDARGG
jgi:bile acid-coenzyme A ligase